MPRPRRDAPRGIVQPAVSPSLAAGGLARYLPSDALAPGIEHYWTVRWDLREHGPYRQAVLPHPTLHLSVEATRAEIVGVVERRFERELEGVGWVFAIKFRPAMFRTFVGRACVADWTNTSAAVDDVFGAAGRDYVARIRDVSDDESRVAAAEAFLLARMSAPDPQALALRDLVESVADDRSITRVDQLVERFDGSKRSLQRAMRDYVGVSPKWIIQRYRMHDLMLRLDGGEPANWAALASEFGYFDQAHFIRDFEAMVGKSPRDYARGQ